MAEPSTKRMQPQPPEEPSPNGAESLEELRHLILAPEQEALDRLHVRVSDPEARTEDVSTVVAEAIQRRRQRGGDEALSDALAPTIETALRESVRKDPATLADALFPVMGPAIRRSILETLRSFLESFNQIMDQSLSWQGIQWRFEALRTGRTFTEVALLHSLVYRVEQVFLIHKKTGLSLGHAVAPSVAMQDPSLVSGMLSAIQDFVRDSFHTGREQGVNRMNVGDLDVWVEQGPYAILACVIRGIAPRQLRDTMAEVLETVHRRHAEEMDHFEGDTAPFADVNQLLSPCLETKYREEEKKSGGMSYAWGAAALLVFVLGGVFGYRWWQEYRWSKAVEKMRAEPGLVITGFGRENGKFLIRGLRDPLAKDPLKIVEAEGLKAENAEFHWGGYYALDDALVAQRATALLSPPKGVSLTVQNGVLYPAGPAPLKWMKDLSIRALLVPGIRSVDISGSFSPEQIAFDLAKTELEETLIKFPLASAELSASEIGKLSTLPAKLKTLQQTAAVLKQNAMVEVVGHSDSSGAERTNEYLSRRRAERVVSELEQMGIADSFFHARGVATGEPLRPEDNEEDRQFNRSVTFRVRATAKP